MESPVQDPDGYHALTPEQVLAALVTGAQGLSSIESTARLQRFGPNELRLARPRSAWAILLAQLRSLVVLLLLAAAVFSFAIGDALDASAILAVLLINTVIGFVTEQRAHRAMHALLTLEAPRALVLRDGERRDIPATELVPGDVIEMHAGSAVPADGRVLHTIGLRVDESAITGESMPVDKVTHALAPDTELADRANCVFQGTIALAGSGQAVVTRTGASTELGRIGALISGVELRRTPLERRLDLLGRRLALLALAAGGLVAAVGLVHGLPVALVVKTGIALAIAAVPEGLPAVATIALAVGVYRMARRNAIVRRLPSVEALGSVTLVCTDKTGTLTAGQMTATRLWLGHRTISVTGTGYGPDGYLHDDAGRVNPGDDPVLAQALRVGALANRARLVDRDGEWAAEGDPTEAALLTLVRKGGLDPAALVREDPETGEVPFSSERMLMATFHGDSYDARACVKGAPDAVLARCATLLTPAGAMELDARMREAVTHANERMAADGLRVLALAAGHVRERVEDGLDNLTFLGLVGIADPAAEGVADTVALLHQAGINTVMITGDQALTAVAVATEIGIPTGAGAVATGATLKGTSRADTLRVRVFSRVTPEQKLAIISTWQDAGHVVAMIGDGVNDGPALRKADVGVTMGGRGTDVAREVAAIVLRDDRFSTIGLAVREGRVVFDNIRKFVFYLFSCNLAEVLVLVIAATAGMPLPLTPLQILWLNIVTDTFPALALAVEPAETDVMCRPPRDPRAAILSRDFLLAVGLHALTMAVSCLIAFQLAFRSTGDVAVATTVAFLTLALAQTFHLANARSRRHVLHRSRLLSNRWAAGAVVFVVLLQVLAVEFAPLAVVLRTVPLAAPEWIMVIAMSLVPAAAGQARAVMREV